MFSKANFIINKQYISEPRTLHTFIDSSYIDFRTYFAYKRDNTVRIIQEYNTTDYRLDKYILLAVQYTNTTDTVVSQKLYSNIYNYKQVGEMEVLGDNLIRIKASDAIHCNRQFISIRLLPRQTISAYLLYKPISFKEYSTQKNILYNYSSIYDFPKYPTKIQKRNFGFTLQFLFLLGMILIMLIFYIVAYVYLRDKIYLYYTFYLIITFVQVLYMAQYILCKNLMMFNIVGNNVVDEATKGLMIFFYTLFYKQAFAVTKKDYAILLSLDVLKYLSILYVLFICFGDIFNIPFYREPLTYNLFRVPIFFFSVIFLVFTYLYKQRSYFQNIIFFGTLVYLFFTVISIVQSLVYPFKDLYVDINIFYLGVALELIIFSIALIIRIKDSFLTSERLKDALILQLQQNEEYSKNENLILEKRVQDRANEIHQQNILIEEQKRQALMQGYEKEKLKIQLHALSLQMNPHFIFNCMNSIQHLIVTNQTEKASQMLHEFATLIRMVLENSAHDEILLEDEIKLIKTYLTLEKERTNHSFDFNIYIDAHISTDFLNIPTMMIQPFLENALIHGFKSINYKGKLDIHISIKDQLLYFQIADNGIGRAQAMKNQNKNTVIDKKSLAIQIILNRIQLINQHNTNPSADLLIEDLYDAEQKPLGTRVNIYLPIS
ncbi:MAG: histidine kinase [Chitinophagales bacterium]|nr:histidine kinase [Chitinophagales bacterium]